MDARGAASQLGIGRAGLYRLRAGWLGNRKIYQPRASGGDRRGLWPAQVHTFLAEFLPLQNPPNYQLVCDEMERLYGFRRARSTAEAYIKRHFAHLVFTPPKKNRVYRRFRRASIGELWQHDSSIHQWGPASAKQVLLLTVDDHSGLNLAGRFVSADTTWNHFLHFREAFEVQGIPQVIYTDGLSLFGPSSSDDRIDPKSQFQRALRPGGSRTSSRLLPRPKAKASAALALFKEDWSL